MTLTLKQCKNGRRGSAINHDIITDFLFTPEANLNEHLYAWSEKNLQIIYDFKKILPL